MMENKVSDLNESFQKPNKSRRSIFLPEVSIVNTTVNKNWDEEYFKKIKLEKESWKRIYEEQKQHKKNLQKELETNEPQSIDYSLFSEEEIEYLNAGPDIGEFVKEAENLQELIKVLNIERRVKKQRYEALLEDIEKTRKNITHYFLNK